MPVDDSVFDARLLPGEHILWSGAPAQGILFTSQDWFLVPFSLLWCGFAVFWTITVSGSHAPPFFLLWGLMFVVIGLFFVFGRFFVDAAIRRSLRYAVTEKRVLIARTGRWSQFTALNLGNLPGLNLIGAGGGRGTIRFAQVGIGFAQAPGRYGNGWGPWVSGSSAVPQFVAIENADSVFSLIQREAAA